MEIINLFRKMETNREITTEKKTSIIPDWQIKQVRERTEEYSKNPSIAQDFHEAMKEIKDEL
jgi:hypothetical protein